MTDPPIRRRRLAGQVRDTDQPPPIRVAGRKRNHRISRQNRSLRHRSVPWQVGMLTAPRPGEPTIFRTLDSLAAAGFPDVHVFAEGDIDQAVVNRPGVSFTLRQHPSGSFCNWWLALWELWMRESNADRYLLVEDDVVFCKSIREYIESTPLPDAGVLSLYVSTGGEGSTPGWHPAAEHRKGVGALAYLWTNQSMRRLLESSAAFTAHRAGTGRLQGITAQDTAISRWCEASGLPELYHTPSLCQHIGLASTQGHGASIGRRRSGTFVGEDFDARLIHLWRPTDAIRRPSLSRTYSTGIANGDRIGLVGYNVNNDEGNACQSLANFVSIDKWLVRVHPKLPTRTQHELVDSIVCQKNCANRKAKIRKFLNGLGVVVFVNQPIFSELIPMCRESGIKTMCVMTPGSASTCQPDFVWQISGEWPDESVQIDSFLLNLVGRGNEQS